MKKWLYYILTIAFPVCLIASVNNQPEIKLTANKDYVLPISLRTSVLEVTETCLNRSDETFITAIKEVRSPYPAKAAVVTSEEPETNIIVYDDVSILELIQVNFSSQIRGTLAKGNVHYLQLNGGGMLEKGDSFPVQIPQIEGTSFTITILEITPRSYILKMNDVIQEFDFEKTSGIIKNSAK